MNSCSPRVPASVRGPWFFRPLALLAIVLLVTGVGQAQDQAAGQDDLNEATRAKLSAKQMQDLDKVVTLCESALSKGLDADNKQYAEDLLSATLYEQVSRLSRLIFEQQPPDPQWRQVRELCLPKLNRALELRPKMGSSLLLSARLQALPGGDREDAKKKLTDAIPLLAEDPDNLSQAYMVQAGMQQERDAVKADLDKAIELNPRNFDAWRARGVFYLSIGEPEKAVSDLQELLTQNPDDMVAHQAIAQTFRQLKQYDKAMQHLDEIIKNDPNSSLGYNLRARIEEEQGNLEAAIESLNQAVRIEPRDLGAILSRARLRLAQEQLDLARSDIDRALQLRPGLPQAILLRSLAFAAQKRFGDAIGDLHRLLKRADDGGAEIKLQMGTYYEMDSRPRKAIEIYTEILTAQPEYVPALRRRGDALLSIGKHSDAVHDYEAAEKLLPDDPGLLNNLAWVLATSTQDDVRNGQRALEVAKKACELTEFKAPHMVSTLAASYAELGNFDEAIKWSEKAVAADPGEEQLGKELASYREKKAWREQQVQTENTVELKIEDEEEKDLPNFDLKDEPPADDLK